MVFLNPLASTLKVWMVFFFVLNILFKSISAWCANQGQLLCSYNIWETIRMMSRANRQLFLTSMDFRWMSCRVNAQEFFVTPRARLLTDS